MESKASRKPYPSDVADDEWVFVAPYLTLMREDAPQRTTPAHTPLPLPMHRSNVSTRTREGRSNGPVTHWAVAVPVIESLPLVRSPQVKKDWTAMAQSFPMYDKKEQFQKIETALLEGEKIYAVFDMKGGGTGFIGITELRVIVYDKSFMRKMKAVVSIPYSRIYSVAAEDESGVLTGRGFFGSSKMVLKTSGDDYEFEFRGSDKAHIAHNLILGFMVRPAH